MSEWLRRQTRNLLGFACAGSNPAVDDFFIFVFFGLRSRFDQLEKADTKILILIFGSGYLHEENRL